MGAPHLFANGQRMSRTTTSSCKTSRSQGSPHQNRVGTPLLARQDVVIGMCYRPVRLNNRDVLPYGSTRLNDHRSAMVAFCCRRVIMRVDNSTLCSPIGRLSLIG